MGWFFSSRCKDCGNKDCTCKCGGCGRLLSECACKCPYCRCVDCQCSYDDNVYGSDYDD